MPGTRIATTETDYLKASDKSWIGARMGLQDMRSITLDISSFSATHIVNGAIPSGTALGMIESSGKYGPYNPEATGANEKVSIVATGGTAGDFTITFQGETTAAIPYNATATQVRDALLLLSNIEPGDIDVTGGPLPTTAVVIEFEGQYAGQNVPDLTVTDNITNGNATPTVTAGGSGDGRENLAGHLFESVKCEALTEPDCGAALFWRGIVRFNRLPRFTFGAGDEGGTGGTAGEVNVSDFPNLTGTVAQHGQIRYEGVA